jgi:glycosyltransferase involved in cell wall biosynthesis
MLKDKGIVEFVEAAKVLKSKFPYAEFALLGPLDVKNPTAISSQQIQNWVDQGAVTYWGISTDVRLHISRADCIVLPSYREGTPRTLLEGAAMGRPLIASDVPGCKDLVRDGHNGLLCKDRDYEDLAKKMAEVLGQSDETLMIWGRNSRDFIEKNYDERFVIEKYLKVVDSVA